MPARSSQQLVEDMERVLELIRRQGMVARQDIKRELGCSCTRAAYLLRLLRQDEEIECIGENNHTQWRIALGRANDSALPPLKVGANVGPEDLAWMCFWRLPRAQRQALEAQGRGLCVASS